MKKTILSLLAALMLAGPLLAADKPLVIESGQTKQLPAATSLQLSAPTTANASVNMPHGTAPTSPVNGDCWTTTTGLFCRINGATVGPYGAGGGTITLTGDVTGSGSSSIATTLATVNSNVGTFGSATQSLTATVNAKGLVTAISAQTVTPAFSSITGTAAVTQGGNGLTTATLGDLRYGSGTNTLAILAGNTAAARKFLSQTGTGTVSAAPAWGTLAATDMPAFTGGDVTSSAGSGTLAIGANKVTSSMLRQGAGLSVVGVTGSATANEADIAGTANQVLRLSSSGTALGFGSVNLASSTAVTGALPVANGGTNASTASGTALDNITGFSSTGLISRTAAGTYAFRTLTAGSAKIAVSNGDGISGNPTVDLGSVADTDLAGTAWASWTPTWTNVTIGNATVVARYKQVGKTVFASMHITLGSTTAVSGQIIFSLPVTGASPVGDHQGYASGILYDASAGTLFDCQVQIAGLSTSTGNIKFKAVSGSNIVLSPTSGTAPFTWAVSDEIAFSFIYEAA